MDNKKNGMGMMVLFILLYVAAAAFTTIGAMFYWIPLMVIGIIWLSLGWIPFLRIKSAEATGSSGTYFVW